jgi:hypothetical protein
VISGNSDERMAFVLETESHLQGIKAARAEITGVGTDADALGGRLGQFSAKSKAAFDQMTAAEQKAFLGFIGLKDGAEQATTAIDKQTASSTRAAAALANPAFAASARQLRQENAATAQSFDPVNNKARTAANAMSTLGFAAAGLTAGGAGTVIAMGNLAGSLAHLSSSARVVAGASGIGAIVTVAATLIPILMKMGDETERISGGFRRAFGGADAAGSALFLKLAQARRQAAEQAYENAPTYTMGGDVVAIAKERAARKKARDEAVLDEQAAIAADLSAKSAARDKDREDARRAIEQRVQDEIRAREMGEQMRGRTIQLGLERTSPELAAVTGIQMEQAARDAAIDKLEISEDERNRRKIESARLAEAEITKVYSDEADKRIAKADEEARRQDSVDKAKAKKRLETTKANVHAIVMTEGSVLQTMKRLALEPIVSRLEGLAAQQAVEVLTSWPNFAAMAAHGAAAAAATAAAREVAGWAGSSSRSGGSAGSGGGGSGAGSFEPRSSTEGQGSVTIQLYTQNPYGVEQMQQVQYLLERAGIMKRPGVQIPPTSGLIAAGGR